MMTLHESISLGAAILKAESRISDGLDMDCERERISKDPPNFVDMFQE